MPACARLFGCAAARDRGACGNRLNIRIDALEEAILAGLHERLMAPELFKEFGAEFHRELDRLRNQESAGLEDRALAEQIKMAAKERNHRDRTWPNPYDWAQFRPSNQ